MRLPGGVAPAIRPWRWEAIVTGVAAGRGRTAVPPPAGSARSGGPSGDPPTGASPPKMPPGRTLLWFFAILAANFVVLQLLKPRGEQSITVPYTFFKEEVAKGNVEAIYSRGDTLTGRFKTPVTWPPPGEKGTFPKPDRGAPQTGRLFATTLPAFVDRGLEKLLIEHGVEISARPTEEQ